MPQSKSVNRQFVLNSRPNGAPVAADFRLKQAPLPVPTAQTVLLKTLYLSLDPYMRGRMSEGPSYAAPVAIGEVMVGATVSRVESAGHPDFMVGDLVLGSSGWQDYALSDGEGLTKLSPDMTHSSLALGVLGMPGLTAYVGLLDIGQPKAGETVAVAAATGAVGSVVGQLAKLNGCRVVAIAGGPEKCRYGVEVLGFDGCIDHYAPDFAQLLKAACPSGIDVYFENVGGAVFNAILPVLNTHARVPVCGLISQYNATEGSLATDLSALLMRTILTRRIKMQGFIVGDHYAHRHHTFLSEMSRWVNDGQIKYREDVVAGLENTPQAFIGLLEGKNFGKLIVKVADA